MCLLSYVACLEIIVRRAYCAEYGEIDATYDHSGFQHNSNQR